MSMSIFTRGNVCLLFVFLGGPHGTEIEDTHRGGDKVTTFIRNEDWTFKDII